MQQKDETAAVDAARKLKTWFAGHKGEVPPELRRMLQELFFEIYQLLPDDPDESKLRGVLANTASILVIQGMNDDVEAEAS